MKNFSLVIAACAIVMGGCTGPQVTDRGSAAAEETYVPLGSAIPRKKKDAKDDKSVNLQQLQNERDMSNGTNNGGR